MNKVPAVCLYFQLHQPFRLRPDFHFFDIGGDKGYEAEDINKDILRRVSRECYLPTNKVLLSLIKKYPGRFSVTFGITGTILEQFKMWEPSVIDSFRELVDTGQVELTGETYYHSLACIKSVAEFRKQVELHKNIIKDIFDFVPKTFRNSELIYNNNIAKEAKRAGFSVVLTEGVDKVLKGRTSNVIYKAPDVSNISILLKNYTLSDDIAFRFQDKVWGKRGLTPSKFAKKIINGIGRDDQLINLFMDYETFGEHHKRDTGIHSFLRDFIWIMVEKYGVSFKTPQVLRGELDPEDTFDTKDYISWADTERDLSAWLGNSMQQSSFESIYSLEKAVMASNNVELISKWRRLLATDHVYYSSTKGLGDGNVHSYFSPFPSPHDAFVVFNNIVNDMRLTLQGTTGFN